MKCVLFHIPSLFLYVAEPPRITTHPHDLKDAVRGKQAKFTVQATGTEPLPISGSGTQPRRRVGVWTGTHVLQSGVMVLQYSSLWRSPMKGATAVLSLTLLVARLQNQLKLMRLVIVLARVILCA